MLEKSKNINKNPKQISQKTIVANLIGGILLTMTHGGFLDDHHQDMTPKDFQNKVVKEAHTHEHHHILADPRNLRVHNPNNSKLNRFRGMRDNWDIYSWEA